MKISRYISVFCLIVFTISCCYGRRDADSIRKIIETTKSDSIKILSFTNLATEYFNTPDKAFEIISELGSFFEKIKGEKNKAFCLRKIGVLYQRLGYIDKSLEYTIKSAILFEKINDKEGLANCYNNIANAYSSKGELTNNSTFYDKAVEYHLKGIKLRKEIAPNQLSNSYLNIGLVYSRKNDYEKAIEFFEIARSLYIRDSAISKGKNGITLADMNLGEAYLQKGIHTKDKKYLLKALNLFEVYKNDTVPLDPRVASIFCGIGNSYYELAEYKKSILWLEKAMKMALLTNSKIEVKYAAELLNKVYEKKGDYKNALHYMHIYNRTKDTLINEKNLTENDQMQVLFNSLRKDNEIEKLNSTKKIQDLELSRNRTILLASFGGIFLVIVFSLFLYSRFRVISNQKKIIEVQKQKVDEKNYLIEEKQKEILDSIKYAKRIQQAHMPTEKYVEKNIDRLKKG